MVPKAVLVVWVVVAGKDVVVPAVGTLGGAGVNLEVMLCWRHSGLGGSSLEG